MAIPVTDKDLLSQFWDKWYHANELDRLKLVQQLTGMGEHTVATLTNSYLTDLAKYLEGTFKVSEGGNQDGS